MKRLALATILASALVIPYCSADTIYTLTATEGPTGDEFSFLFPGVDEVNDAGPSPQQYQQLESISWLFTDASQTVTFFDDNPADFVLGSSPYVEYDGAEPIHIVIPFVSPDESNEMATLAVTYDILPLITSNNPVSMPEPNFAGWTDLLVVSLGLLWLGRKRLVKWSWI